MGIAITLDPEERRQENELLWRIAAALPEDETREFHRLLRRKRQRSLTDAERERLLQIVEARELRAAQRLQDLGALSRLRGVPVRELMVQLGIAPCPQPPLYGPVHKEITHSFPSKMSENRSETPDRAQ